MVIYIRPLLVFIYGYVIGVLIAYLVFTNRHPDRVFTWNYNNGIEDIGEYKSNHLVLNDEFKTVANDNDYYMDEKYLKNKVLLLCIMFVKDIDNAYVSSNTWMWKCNHQLYFGLKSDNYLNVVVMNPSNSWHYLCSVFRYVIDNFNHSYHWILFSKDNNFVIPNNLRQIVVRLNYSDPYYLGHKSLFWNTYFNSGKSSYVLSKGTIDILMKKFKTDEECLKGGQHWNMEDYYLGKHLAQLGIHPSDTRDSRLRARFHIAPMSFLFMPLELQKMRDYDSRSFYKEVQGEDCCSSTSVSFPVTSASSAYFYSYLINIVRVCKDSGMLNATVVDDRVWREFVLEMNPNANLSSITAQKYYDIWNNIIDPPTIFNQKLRELFLNRKEPS